nr:MAG TPA: hypothetical protein [Caudoviricetes sp.]
MSYPDNFCPILTIRVFSQFFPTYIRAKICPIWGIATQYG